MNNISPHEDLLRGLPTKTFSPEQEANLIASNAYDELALHSMREAFFYALACARTLPPDEVYSLCWKALSASVRNFKPGRSHRFFAFAKPYIRGEICRTFKRYKVVTKGETETLPPQDMEEVEDGKNFMNQTAAFQKATTVEPDFQVIMARDEWASLKPLLAKLREKERMVLQLTYQSGFNFVQIGKLLNVSRSDIQATHANSIRKLRCAVARNTALFNR